jgi:hypothetical protein
MQSGKFRNKEEVKPPRQGGFGFLDMSRSIIDQLSFSCLVNDSPEEENSACLFLW